MEGHVSLKELDTHWTIADLQEYHKALSLKDRLKSGFIGNLLGGIL